MRPSLLSSILFASVLSSSFAHADDLGSNPNDPGKITRIRKGVWEVDFDALGVLSSSTQNSTTATRFSTDGAATISRFVRDNLSVGVSILGSYDTIGGNDYSILGGAALVTNVHMRLGMGAFFKPGVAVGVLVGNHNTPLMSGLTEQDTQIGLIARLQLPIAYFVGRRFMIQAGPQLDFTAGNITPTGKPAQTFTQLAGGFAIGAGYLF
jgi:hypothetical protein